MNYLCTTENNRAIVSNKKMLQNLQSVRNVNDAKR